MPVFVWKRKADYMKIIFIMAVLFILFVLFVLISIVGIIGMTLSLGEVAMGTDNDLRKNGSGYSDPTAYNAIKNIDYEDEQFHKLLYTIRNMCDLAGFQIEGRIVLTDKKTGRTWR